MDKKQTLTPELKQIYERVMNTPVASSSKSQSTPVAPPLQQSTPVAQKPVVTTAHATPAPVPNGGFVFSASTQLPHSTGPAASTPITSTAVLSSRKSGGGVKLAVFGGITFLVFYVVFWLKVLKYM